MVFRPRFHLFLAITQANLENGKIETLKSRKDEAYKQNEQIQDETTGMLWSSCHINSLSAFRILILCHEIKYKIWRKV